MDFYPAFLQNQMDRLIAVLLLLKKKNEKKFTHGEHVTIYPDAPESVASATECTGLMPTPPQNDAEFMSYQDLHSMEIPKKLPGKRNFELGVYDDKPEDIQL